MFKKEPSENEASPELTELAAPAGPVQKSDPAPVGNTMLLIGAIPLVLFLVAAVIGDRIIGLVLFVLAAIGFFIMWKKATGALSSSLGALRDEAFAVANDDLPRLGQALSSGAPISELSNTRQPVTFEDPDFASVASGLTAVRESAAGIGDNVSALQSGISDTFVNLARRNQALVDRQLEAIDTLEAEERDSDRLSLLYRVDHLATRMHRNAESLLVLADAKTPERHSPAVALREIIRVAIGEVEDYRRIVPISLDEVNVAGHKAQDMAHLLAELMENAAQHSPPGTAVDVTGVQNTATGDYTITILDHGTGLAADQLVNLNTLLERPPASTLTISHSIGLQVVSRISHSLGIRVRLDHGEDGGVVATVTVPSAVVNTWSKVVPGQVGVPVNETAAPIAPPVAPTAPLAPIPDLAAPISDLAAPAPVAEAPAPIPDLAAPAPVAEAPAPIPDLAAPAPVADPSSVTGLGESTDSSSTFPTIGEDLTNDSAMPLESLLDPSTGLDDDMLTMPLPKPVGDLDAAPAFADTPEAPAADSGVGGFEVPVEPEVFEPGNSTFEMPAEPEVFEPGNSTFEMPAEPEVFEPGNSTFEPAPVAEAPAPVAEAPAPIPDLAAPAPVAEAPAPIPDLAAPAPVAEAPAPIPDLAAPAPVAEAPAPVVDPAPVAAAPLVGAAAAAPAATAVATATGAAGKTASGLTKRTRTAPSATPPVNFDEGRTAPSQRSPDQVKSMLSRYKSGLERGRGSAETDGE